MEYSQLIMNYIESTGVSAYKISKATGISESTFSKWKSNPTSDISLLKIKKIADFFNVTLDYLLTGESDTLTIGVDTQYKKQLFLFFQQLNKDGQEAALTVVGGLTLNAKFVKKADDKNAATDLNQTTA